MASQRSRSPGDVRQPSMQQLCQTIEKMKSDLSTVVSMGANMQADLQALKEENKLLKEKDATISRKIVRDGMTTQASLDELKKQVVSLQDDNKSLKEMISAVCGLCNRQSKRLHDNLEKQLYDVGKYMQDQNDDLRRLIHEQENVNKRLSEEEGRVKQVLKDQSDRLDLIYTGLLERVTGVSPTANAAISLALYTELINRSGR